MRTSPAKTAALTLLMLTGTSSVAAQGDIDVPLTNDYTLSVKSDHLSKKVTVSLSWHSESVISVQVGNAGFTPEEVRQVQLCDECEAVYFLPVWDASSTYGAVTGVIAWPNGRWWSLSILPMSRPTIEDPDGDGIFDLVDQRVSGGQVETERYTFRDGLIAKADQQ